MRGPGTSAQMRRTASISRSDTAGKPASMTSTPAAARALAMTTLSSTEKRTPGICAPSRKVVSEMVNGVNCTDGFRDECSGMGLFALFSPQRQRDGFPGAA